MVTSLHRLASASLRRDCFAGATGRLPSARGRQAARVMKAPAGAGAFKKKGKGKAAALFARDFSISFRGRKQPPAWPGAVAS